MEFKDSRSVEIFEAAAARNDETAIALQIIVAQTAYISVLPLSLKDKCHLVDGLALIIDQLSPGFMQKHMPAALKIGAAMDADKRDYQASHRS